MSSTKMVAICKKKILSQCLGEGKAFECNTVNTVNTVNQCVGCAVKCKVKMIATEW